MHGRVEEMIVLLKTGTETLLKRSYSSLTMHGEDRCRVLGWQTAARKVYRH